MNLGVCYYPEHWPPERWPIDAQLMRDAGLSIVRIGEFAWQRMEPAEGQFNWAWLDQAIDTLANAGLKLVLGTPTATPPAWLCKAHPDILPIDAQGRRLRFGARRHYCANAPHYRAHTERIVRAMAERYGQHPAVIAWQVDNEFGDHDTARCYCDHCVAAFRRWLQAKYASLEALNAAWGTVFWSQTYSAWDEIGLPHLTPAATNPSHHLDYYRFASDSFVNYAQLQISILQSLTANSQKITTNLLGILPVLNCFDLARDFDFVAWDSYPTGFTEVQAQALYADEPRPAFAYDTGDPYVIGFCHALTRGLKNQQPFWIMEQQCGNINWSVYNTGVRPGTVRLWTWYALASGAETVMYFRWRACLYAQEQMHSGLRNHDASPALGYDELLQMLPEREQLAQLAAQPLRNRVALLIDYDDLWAIQLQPHRKDFGYYRHVFVFYRALQRLGIPVDVVGREADLSPYRLVLAPTAHLVDQPLAQRLTAFVQNGGHALLGVRSGFKTRTNLVTDQPLPGLWQPLVGATVTAWHALPPEVGYDFSSEIPGFLGPATVWAESLKAPRRRGAEASDQSPISNLQSLATYTSGPFATQSALTQHAVGRGFAFYLGLYPTLEQAQALLAHLAAHAGVARLAELPRGLLAAQRGERVILLNFTDETRTATTRGQTVTVPGRGVQIVG
jgi:beta-galactosidase